MSHPITLIAAIGENHVIGDNGRIPWRLPSDFAFFKAMTLGKPLIMGRKTFESIGKPLRGRTNLVVSRKPGYQPDGVIVISSLDAALLHADTIATADTASEIIVAGGGEIYREAMPRADRLIITHVALAPEGDAHFPPIDPDLWQVVERPDVPRTERDSADFCVKIYHRRLPA
jgi:dihydrofolate reductase